MSQDAIFGPMGALALLTFIVLGVLPFRRAAAARAGQVTLDDFRNGETAAVPAHAAAANRNFVNLLELPLLFYVVCLMYFVAGRVTPNVLGLAWAYVALRAVHSAIHLTYNKVLHRFAPYALSAGVLVAMWVMFFVG